MKDKQLHKYCLRCGRLLKSQEARERGFGKICFEKMRKEPQKNHLFDVEIFLKNS